MGKWTELINVGSKLLARNSVKAMEKVSPRMAARFGGTGAHMGESTLMKYIFKSGEAGRFKVVETAASKAERKAVGKVFEESGVTKASKTGKTVLHDTKTGEHISMREAASRVHPSYVSKKNAELASKVEEVHGKYGKRYIISSNANPYRAPTVRDFDKAEVSVTPLRSLNRSFNEVRPSLAELRQSIHQNLHNIFGDSALGRAFTNMFERMFGIPRAVSPKAAEAVEGTTEQAAKGGWWIRLRTQLAERVGIKPKAVGQSTTGQTASEATEEATEQTAKQGWWSRTKKSFAEKQAARSAAQEQAAKDAAVQEKFFAAVDKRAAAIDDMLTGKIKTTGSARLDGYVTKRAAREVKQSAAASIPGKEWFVKVADGKFQAMKGASFNGLEIKAGQTYSSIEARNLLPVVRKAEMNRTWTEWLKTEGREAIGQGKRFVENESGAFSSKAAQTARERGKTIFDTETKRFITPKQAAKQVWADERVAMQSASRTGGPKTAKEIAEVARKAATTNKHYPVSEEMYDHMKPYQQERLRAIQLKEEGFAERRKAIEEMRRAANSIPSKTAQDAAERSRLLSDAAKEQSQLTEDIAKNQLEFANLVREADKSIFRKTGEFALQHPKLTGWGSLGAGYLVYHNITGKGAFGIANDVLGDKVPKRDKDGNIVRDKDGNIEYVKTGLVPTVVDVAFGQGTSDKTADFIQNQVAPPLVRGTHYVVNGVDYVFDQAGNVWNGIKMIAAAGSKNASEIADYIRNNVHDINGGQRSSVPQYTWDSQTNGWVDNGTGYYHDPSAQSYPQYNGGVQSNQSFGQGLGGQMMNTLNSASNYVTGQNVSKIDLGKLIAASLLTFGRFGLIGKIGGLALGGMTAHDINTRGEQQQMTQQQQQQYASQLYNQQSKQEAEAVHRGL